MSNTPQSLVQAFCLQDKDDRHDEDIKYRAIARTHCVDIFLYNSQGRKAWFKRIATAKPVVGLEITPDHVIIRSLNGFRMCPLTIANEDMIYQNKISGSCLYRVWENVYRLCENVRTVRCSDHFHTNKIIRYNDTIVSCFDNGYKVARIINGKMWHQLTEEELSSEDVKAWLHMKSSRTDIAHFMETIDSNDCSCIDFY